jgi:hypothetical protein
MIASAGDADVLRIQFAQPRLARPVFSQAIRVDQTWPERVEHDVVFCSNFGSPA